MNNDFEIRITEKPNHQNTKKVLAVTIVRDLKKKIELLQTNIDENELLIKNITYYIEPTKNYIKKLENEIDEIKTKQDRLNANIFKTKGKGKYEEIIKGFTALIVEYEVKRTELLKKLEDIHSEYDVYIYEKERKINDLLIIISDLKNLKKKLESNLTLAKNKLIITNYKNGTQVNVTKDGDVLQTWGGKTKKRIYRKKNSIHGKKKLNSRKKITKCRKTIKR